MPDLQVGDILKIKPERLRDFRGNDTTWDCGLFRIKRFTDSRNAEFYVTFPESGRDDHNDFRCQLDWFNFHHRSKIVFGVKLDFAVEDVDQAIELAQKTAKLLNINAEVISFKI